MDNEVSKEAFVRHLAYLFSILFFCGLPWLIMLKYQERVLKRYEKVILIVVVVSLIFSTSEYFALRWGAWYFNPKETLNIHFPGELETLFFGIAASLAIASGTVIYASITDRKNRQKKRKIRK